MKTAIRLVERGYVPKSLLRRGIRRLLRARLAEQSAAFEGDREAALGRWAQEMRRAPIALAPEKANEQHYELPPEFFRLVLGRRRKYSSAYYANEVATLDQAEETMLGLTIERAELRDGQRVLELGCGWGSLTLAMAERFPASQIVAVSNSAPQRAHIQAEARQRGFSNLRVLTRDMNAFDWTAEPVGSGGGFDRIVSVEMFEHMRNWEALLARLASWLRPEGRLFLHVFAHVSYAYPFEVRDASDWMSRFFFTGGMMPSHDLLDHLDTPFETEQRWQVSGEHYARTAEDWLRNLERQRAEVLPILAATYGDDRAELWYQRWRIFFLACAELFAFDEGRQWVVSHQRLRLAADGSRR